MEEVEAKPQNDIWFYHGPVDYTSLDKGMLAVFFPNDAHAPNVSLVEGGCGVRKCVLKIHV